MWLLAQAIRESIERAQNSGVVPTAAQQAEYVAAYGYVEGDSPRILSVVGDVARVSVTGVVTKTPSFLATIFGGGNVTYGEIIAAVAEANQRPDVKTIELRVDSPGGHVDGLFEAMDAIRASGKPVRAVVQNRAASAAFGLVSQAGEIVAANRAASFGSIGIAASYSVYPGDIDIASTEAPKKRPDITTPAGQAVVREELDALHALFAESIAAGRGVTVDTVNATYGQGGTLLADEALSRGMIDAIASPALTVVKSQKTPNKRAEARPMDLTQLRAEHPSVYAAAVEAGVAQERDRVTAHLVMGEACGDVSIAVAAIRDGTGNTAAINARYLAAGMNRSSQAARQTDSDAAAAALDGAAVATADDTAEQVCRLVEQNLGAV